MIAELIIIYLLTGCIFYLAAGIHRQFLKLSDRLILLLISMFCWLPIFILVFLEERRDKRDEETEVK